MDRAAALRNRTRPLKVLLLGRTRRCVTGGIARSARMIVDALKRAGDEVRLRSCNQPLVDIPSDTDIIWHYGDIDHLSQQIEAAAEAKVPIIINSTFDNTADRRAWMIDLVAGWERAGASWARVYFVVFTEAARLDPRLHRIKDRLVTVPKTVRFGGGHVLGPGGKAGAPWSFEDREGICLGELEKLCRVRLTRGMDVVAAVDQLRAALPGVPIYSYDQYATADTAQLAGVTVVKPERNMMNFLCRLRLFVSFSAHETFAMVPAEAQGVGTPVLYRPMPQSLSEHFGLTAYPFDTIDELVTGATKLYSDEPAWRAYSAAGVHNAIGRSAMCAGVALDLALRKVVFR